MGHPQLIECMGICVLSLAHGSELNGPDVYLHIVEKLPGEEKKISQGTCTWMAFAWIFFGIFLVWVRGACGANHF